MVSLQAAFAAMALSGFGQTVLLDFYADYCAPCRAMSPTVDALITAGYPVQRVNFEQNRSLAAKYGVQMIPCFIMLVDGRVVDRVEGGTTYSRLERMCKQGISAAPPPMAIPAQNNNPPDQYLVEPIMYVPREAQPTAQPIASPPSPSPAALSSPFDERVNPAVAIQPIPAAAPPVSDAAMLAASVRIRVADRDGQSCGSGTIIDARSGEALVLTCGHLFRDSQGKGQITVELFTSGSPEQVVGRLVSYDLDRDVGLVAIRPTGSVATARLAPPGYRLAPGEAVASVGCNNGDLPTVRRSQVTSLDKYQGPPTVVVAGQPVIGRSGGGLFSSDGYVVGVCSAADPADKEGLFAAGASICAELDRNQLAFVYKSPSENLAANAAGTGAAPPAPPSPAAMPGQLPGPTGVPAALAAVGPVPASSAEPAAGLPPQQQATLEEIRRLQKEGADVVIIVRPRGNPEAEYQVIMMKGASAEFVKQLAAEGRLLNGLKTSMEIPTKPVKPSESKPATQELKERSKQHKILLEWSAPNGVAASNPTSSAMP